MKFYRLTAALLPLVFAGALCSPLTAAHAHRAAISVSAEDPYRALEALSEEYGFDDPREEFELSRTEEAAYGKIYRFRQKFDGKEVYGRGIVLSTDREGKLLFVNADYFPMRGAAACEGAAVYYTLKGTPEPARVFAGEEGATFLSAESGKVLDRIPSASSLMVPTVQTNARGEEVALSVSRSGNGSYTLADEVRNFYVYDLNGGTSVDRRRAYTSDTGVFSDRLAVSAYESLVKAYDYYADAENIGVSRKGINGRNDDRGGNWQENGEIPLWLLMHYSQNYQNASCDFDAVRGAALMRVGDGSYGGPLYHQAAATDIIAHEYQHAITQFTVDLYYLNESGALNEAYSDIFGALIEGHEPSEKAFWEIGEDAVPAGRSPIRSAIVPSGEYRLNARTKFPLCLLNHVHDDDSECDRGGVHCNSTILTHFQYNLWRKHPDFFTRQRIGTLWYSTLLSLTTTADFKEFATQFRATAEALGYPQDVLRSIDEGFFACGITADDSAHLVTFRDAMGQIVEETCVKHGEPAPLPATPERQPTSFFEYTFDSWDSDLSSVTEDMTVYARFRLQPRRFAVRFTDEAGGLLKEERVPYGGAVALPDPPEKPSDLLYDYEFTGWTGGDPQYVTGDLELRPVYRKIRCYTVTFLSENGEVLCTARVREGETAIPDAIPYKESSREKSYPFAGWDGPLNDVREDRTVRAVFAEEPRRYTATFLSDGKLYARSSASYGEILELPALGGKTRKSGERFVGWFLDEDGTLPAEGQTISGDITLYAKWEKTESERPWALALLPLLLLLLLPLPFLLRRRRKKK